MANTIIVQNTPITVISDAERDYISLTDMAGAKNDSSRAADIIKNWMRARYTIEFLGTWESIHNSEFKVVEFDHFRKQAGLPSFVLSVSEWVEKTNAIGFITTIFIRTLSKSILSRRRLTHTIAHLSMPTKRTYSMWLCSA